MNRTSAVEIIIQPLCPGPEVAASAPPLASGAPLVTYASRLASRCSIVGPAAAGAAAGAAAAGAGSVAGAVSAFAGDDATQAAIEIANTMLAPRRRLTRIGLLLVTPGRRDVTRSTLRKSRFRCVSSAKTQKHAADRTRNRRQNREIGRSDGRAGTNADPILIGC